MFQTSLESSSRSHDLQFRRETIPDNCTTLT